MTASDRPVSVGYTRKSGWENVADTAIKWDAWLLFAQCHVPALLLATYDGDFASCAWQLRQNGCQVYGLAGLNVSGKLVEACQSYTIVCELSGLKIAGKSQ